MIFWKLDKHIHDGILFLGNYNIVYEFRLFKISQIKYFHQNKVNQCKFANKILKYSISLIEKCFMNFVSQNVDLFNIFTVKLCIFKLFFALDILKICIIKVKILHFLLTKFMLTRRICIGFRKKKNADTKSIWIWKNIFCHNK